jgi:hypothetical protein
MTSYDLNIGYADGGGLDAAAKLSRIARMLHRFRGISRYPSMQRVSLWCRLRGIGGTESFPAKMTLEIAGLKLNVVFTGDINLQ